MGYPASSRRHAGVAAAAIGGLAGIGILAAANPAEARPRSGLEGVVHGAQIEPWPVGAVPVGTGFLVEEGGRVIVNAHTIAGCRRIRVRVPGTGDREAELLGLDARLDVALLSVPGLSGLPLPPGDGPVATGSRVEVLVLPADGGSGGIVRIPGRVVRGTGGPAKADLIEIAADLVPGHSGSPVVAEGSLVGLVIGRTSADAGRGVMLPVERLNAFLRYFGSGTGGPRRPDAFRLAARDLPIYQVSCT